MEEILCWFFVLFKRKENENDRDTNDVEGHFIEDDKRTKTIESYEGNVNGLMEYLLNVTFFNLTKLKLTLPNIASKMTKFCEIKKSDVFRKRE